MTDPRVREYESRYGCRLLGPLGPGVGQDGFVLRSDRLTAVKFLDALTSKGEARNLLIRAGILERNGKRLAKPYH